MRNGCTFSTFDDRVQLDLVATVALSTQTLHTHFKVDARNTQSYVCGSPSRGRDDGYVVFLISERVGRKCFHDAHHEDCH